MQLRMTFFIKLWWQKKIILLQLQNCAKSKVNSKCKLECGSPKYETQPSELTMVISSCYFKWCCTFNQWWENFVDIHFVVLARITDIQNKNFWKILAHSILFFSSSNQNKNKIYLFFINLSFSLVTQKNSQ